MKTAERIKELVNFNDILQKYGFERNRAGFISCPFHTTDKTPSLKISKSNKSFKCYGCNAGGTVIDFVMLLFNLDFGEALLKIDNDFNLGLTRKLTLRESQEIKRKQRVREKKLKQEQEQKQKQEQFYYDVLDTFILCERQKQEYAPKTPFDEWHPKFTQALNLRSEINLYMDLR